MAREVVYKVVRKDGDRLVSAADTILTLEYRIGEPTLPDPALPEAGPLAFGGYDAAVKWARGMAKRAYKIGQQGTFVVYRAEADGVTPVKTLGMYMDPVYRRRFWQDPTAFTGTEVYDAPEGTVVTRSLTLVEQVAEERSS